MPRLFEWKRICTFGNLKSFSHFLCSVLYGLTAFNTSRLPGGPGRLCTSKPAADKARLTTPLLE